jgi:hypothetical protein
MNGNSGIVPTVDLATNNAYPAMFGNGYGNNGFFGGDGIWAIILLALLFGNNGWGGFGNFGGGFGGMYEFPWLLTGQQGINSNTNNGFDTLHLSNQIEGVRDGVASLSNQLCNCCADMNQTVAQGFYNSEIASANRQMANMNQNFSNQISTLQGFNGIQKSLDNCCCENRLGIANLNSTILSENCADRALLQDQVKDLLINQNASTQRILDQLCADKIESKNDIISQLRQELLYARGQASQVQQTADIRANNATVANQLVSELRSCPIPAQPVYGNTPIFTCNGGCGCGSNLATSF